MRSHNVTSKVHHNHIQAVFGGVKSLRLCCLPLRCCFRSSNFSVWTLHTYKFKPRASCQHACERAGAEVGGMKHPTLREHRTCGRPYWHALLFCCNYALAPSKEGGDYLAIVRVLLRLWGPFPGPCSSRSRVCGVFVARVVLQPHARVATRHGHTHHGILRGSPGEHAHMGVHSILEGNPAM